MDASGRNSYDGSMKRALTATVSEKGQVTIPKALRERLGIRPGQVIRFEANEGALVGRKVPGDRLDEVYGTLDLGMSTDEFMEWLRGPRDDL